MPTTNQRSAAIPPASPRSTSKYTNKDGSKFITVPKGTSDPSPPSTPSASAVAESVSTDPSAVDASDRPVNRKKQKRRQKAAAKAAAVEGNGHALSPSSSHLPPGAYPDNDFIASDDELEFVSPPQESAPLANGQLSVSSKSKKNKKKKKKNANANIDASSEPSAVDPSDELQKPAGMAKDKIWSTSNHEERERIKAFWLGLGEDERKSLVKVEKDAVLKKMKEQQKHTCSCTVCGRKRTAIEEELEGLYDAYYLELEQFANQGEGPPMLPPPPPRDFPMQPPRRLPAVYAGQPPSRGRIVEHVGDDEEEEEEIEGVYSEDEVDDDEYSDDEPPEAFHTSHERDVADFLTFGNSLQVKGGILTVADDLLKNDGKRFIEMMEQLAERRMAREEDAREHFARGYGHPNGSYSTPHPPPPPDEDEYDDEEDEEDDYDDSQDGDYDEEEEDQMTEEQRMEEGRRMFQIFAARMFEQRVLSAYKEKVAKERQQKLLEELEEESRQVDEQKAKKAKNAQKKKDKAAQKKQAQAEEKARKEAEKAAEDAARVEAEQKRVAEQRQKAEEKRRQKEAQRKAEEDARLKKEADRLRRIHEQKEKQAEQERKARESKEREKKLKDEQRQREKEARDQKEREAQERKDKQERDKREKEARAAKALRDAQEATEAKAKAKEEKAAAQKAGVTQVAQPAKRTSQPVPGLSTVLPQHPPNPANNYISPKIPVATPAIPTPIRPRAASQQYDAVRANSVTSQSASGASPSPHSGTPAHTSPGNIGQERKSSFGASSAVPMGLSQPVPPPGFPSSHYHMPPSGMQSPPGLPPHAPPGFQTRLSQDPLYPVGYRPGPNMMMSPPGIASAGGRGLPPPGGIAPPGFSSVGDQFSVGQGFPGMAKDVQQPTHTRQSSASYDGSSTIPIGRPAPIGRPSVAGLGTSHDEDSEPKHLGSSALVGDDEPLGQDMNLTGSLRGQPPGLRSTFGSSPFMDSGAFSMGPSSPWAPAAASTQAFPPPGFSNPGWGAPSMPPGFNVGSPVGGISALRSASQPRHVSLRQMLCQTCKELSHSGSSAPDGFISMGVIKSQIELKSGDMSVTEQELVNLCDTEGSSSNGGGTFDVRRDAEGMDKHVVRWVPDGHDSMGLHYRAVGAPGEIGSPRPGYSSMRGI